MAGWRDAPLVSRSLLALAAMMLLLALAVGCGGPSQNPEESGSGADGASAGEAETSEAVQGTTSRGSTQEAESTVGTLPPQTTDEEAAAASAEEQSTGGAGAGDESAASAASAEPSELSEPHESSEAAPAGQPEEPSAEPQSDGGGAAVSGGGSRAVPDPGKFVASPEDSGGDGYTADSILGVRFGDHEGYERVVVDLGSGQKPTSGVSDWTLSSPTGDGRLKLTFPSVRNTAVSDGSLENAGAELLDSFYVVRSPDGGMFVDIFSERSFYYRVVEISDPSRIAIDFKPAGSELDIPLPVWEGNTVLTQPRRDSGITSPMTVSGYSRNPEASNNIALQGPDGATLAEETVLSNDWTSTWGYFETSLDFQPFTGEGLLKVGTQSARDGSFEGVELPVTNTG